MGHNLDFYERIRFTLARPIGRLVTGVKSVEIDSAEFVGYVEISEEEFEKELHEMDFHRNPLAYWKTFPGFGGEHGSWRWVEGDWQLHVMLFENPSIADIPDGEDRTYIFAHWEYRWDRYPLKHLRTLDQSDSKGVNRMRNKLNLASIPFYNDPTIQ